MTALRSGENLKYVEQQYSNNILYNRISYYKWICHVLVPRPFPPTNRFPRSFDISLPHDCFIDEKDQGEFLHRERILQWRPRQFRRAECYSHFELAASSHGPPTRRRMRWARSPGAGSHARVICCPLPLPCLLKRKWRPHNE